MAYVSRLFLYFQAQQYKQTWQNSSYFFVLQSEMFTHTMAAQRNNVIVTLSIVVRYATMLRPANSLQGI